MCPQEDYNSLEVHILITIELFGGHFVLKYKIDSTNFSGVFDLKNSNIYIDGQKNKLLYNFESNKKKLYILLSKKCNLKCSYCFQKKYNNVEFEIPLYSIIDLVKKHSIDFEEVYLFGGEPLIEENYKAIEMLFSYITNIPIYIFSNGNISKKMKKLLVNNRSKIAGIVITLDGTKEKHDLMRKNPISSSFDNAVDTIQYLSDQNIYVQTQLNISNVNKHDIDALISNLNNDNSTLYNLVLNPIKYTQFSMSPLECLESYIELLRKFPLMDIKINLRPVNNLQKLLTGEKLKKDRCSLESTVVLDFSTGQIYACPQNEASTIGKIQSHQLKFNHNRILSKIQETQFKTEKCINCYYNLLCPFCCPNEKTNHIKCQKEVDALITTFCENFDLFFEMEINNA